MMRDVTTDVIGVADVDDGDCGGGLGWPVGGCEEERGEGRRSESG